MPLNNHKSHHGDAAEYATSALPWVSGSTTSATDPDRIGFPKVTKTITVRNNDATATNGVFVAWTRNGAISSGSTVNRFLIPGGASETFDVRCRDIWLLAQAGTPAVSVYAGLTTVARHVFPLLTGSSLSSSSSLPGEGWQGIG